MPKYIEEKELKDWVENWLYKDRWYRNGRVSKNIPITELYDILEQMPTADVFPVVRCKDCKHSEHWYKDKRRCFLWHEAGIDVFEDGFCSYGERKDDDKIHSR